MAKYINIGYGNIANADKIISIISPDASPVKRMVQHAKDKDMAVDATCGRKTRAVLVMESGHLILSAILPETISARASESENSQLPRIVV